MMMDYQTRRRLASAETAPAAYQLATVAGIFEDGLTLIFDGEGAARVKHYPCNAAVSFSAGSGCVWKRSAALMSRRIQSKEGTHDYLIDRWQDD